MSDAPRLVELPDVAGTLRRDRAFLLNRTVAAILIPILVTMLAKSAGLFPGVAELGLPLEFLAAGPLSYEAKSVAFIAFLLVVLSFLSRRRSKEFLLGIGALAILWSAHTGSRLQWWRFFADDYNPVAPDPTYWAWGALLLASIATIVMIESALETRRAQNARHLDAEQTQAMLHVTFTALVITAGAGLTLFALLATASGLLGGAFDLRDAFPRLNPVFVLFGLGLVVVLALVAALRPRPPVVRDADDA